MLGLTRVLNRQVPPFLLYLNNQLNPPKSFNYLHNSLNYSPNFIPFFSANKTYEEDHGAGPSSEASSRPSPGPSSRPPPGLSQRPSASPASNRDLDEANLPSARSLSVCTRTECEHGDRCANLHIDNGNFKNIKNNFSYSDSFACRRDIESKTLQSSAPGIERKQEWNQAEGKRRQAGNAVQAGNASFPESQEKINSVSFNSRKCSDLESEMHFIDTFTKINKNFNLNSFPSNRKTINRVLNIYSCNVRSMGNKKSTIENIFHEYQIDVGILSEINVRNIAKLKGFRQFPLFSDRRFHGITVAVSHALSENVMKIDHEQVKGLELMHIRIDSVVPLNVIGLYIDVESRLVKDEVQRIMNKITTLSDEILERGESLYITGDFNKNLFVEKPSFGSKLVMDWLDENGTLKLLNNAEKATRIDPVSKKGSILDLGIISTNISSNVTGFYVDTEAKYTPFSITKKYGVLNKKYTDHRALIVSLNLPFYVNKASNKRTPLINMSNTEGWKNYEKISDEYSDILSNIISNNDDVNYIDRQLELYNIEMMVKAFGITWKSEKQKKKKKADPKSLKELYEDNLNEMDVILNNGITGKSLMNKIYYLKQCITGNKVKSQNPSAICHPETNELIVNKEEIKEVSLQHNLKILKKNSPRECDLEEIENKRDNHNRIMNKNDLDCWELDKPIFNKVLNKVKESNKNMYKHLNKSGPKYKEAIFLFMKKMISSEEIPNSYGQTYLCQIWKKKGNPLSLNNMRFIHMRHWRCKLLEALVTEKMKANIVNNTPKTQLGGMPGCSSVEHLVVLKTWMKEKEEKKQLGIFQTFDMAKFFDRESLLDCMFTLDKKANIDSKSYRIWYKINDNTVISVRTSVGDSRSERIYDSVGQGQVGAALVSSLNIGCAIEDTFENIPSSTVAEIPINSFIFQDDIGKLNDNINDARIGSEQIENTLRRKLLNVNYDKSKYIIFGSKKQRKNILSELESNPITMGGTKLDNTSIEKYLGDYIHEGGCEKSISETIDKRIKGNKKKVDELIQLADSSIMSCSGNSLPAFKLFEATVIPSILHNAESWISINDKHIDELQKFQDNFIKRVLRLHDSTPKAILNWDVGLMPMKFRIAQKKLIFFNKLKLKDNDNLCKRVVFNEIDKDIKGLGHECINLCSELGLPNITTTPITKGEIKRAIAEKKCEENRTLMTNSSKCSDRLTDNPEDNSYLACLPLSLSRIWIRYRARCIPKVKVNVKGSHKDLRCRFCSSGELESQEHLEVCEGTERERRGLPGVSEGRGDWRELLNFWRRMMKKLSAAGLKDPLT